MEKFKFIDLFAGIGGIRIPFEEIGGKCVFTSEFDKFAQQTYEANFGERPSGDITLINEKDIPSHDVLLGGFPCQAFSNAGLKKGFDDTRGTLFFFLLSVALLKIVHLINLHGIYPREWNILKVINFLGPKMVSCLMMVL